MANENQTFNYREVIEQEDKLLKLRRERLFGERQAKKLESTRFGIALSGGGIRSATINLGFLKTLHRFGILEQADYLSSVSGGGYTAAYVQAILRQEGSYQQLFQDQHIENLRERGEYLIPGKGWWKIWNRLVLVVSFLISLVMSWVSPAIVLLFAYGLFLISGELPFDSDGYLESRDFILEYGVPFLLALFATHFIVNIFYDYHLDVSSHFESAVSALILVALLCFLALFVFHLHIEFIQMKDIVRYSLLALILFLLGFLANPNALSFHRFYRKRLADAFLRESGPCRNIKLAELFDIDCATPHGYLAPYPLINTCLNLQDSDDRNFAGTKASDYFLLSPLFCGAKLTSYVPTKTTREYKKLTLPVAVTISAAAVNPGMGSYSSRLLSMLTTVFNARLGFWTLNPKRLDSFPLVWWPAYFFRELFAKVGTNYKMVNISDGGHIENLGVYELLRRKCRLIIAVDAGADPFYMFTDLLNLTIRARNELGLELRFRKDQIPDKVIKARASHGYSRQRFAVADVLQIWEELKIPYGVENEKTVEVLVNYGPNPKREKVKITINEPPNAPLSDAERKEVHTKVDIFVEEKLARSCKISTLVYAKPSIIAPPGKPFIPDRNSLEYGTYKYRIYHPHFPHESTADQFFDPIQWEAYYQLGQYLAADTLGIKNLLAFQKGEKPWLRFSIDDLLRHFNPDSKPAVTTRLRPAAEPATPGAEELILAREAKEDGEVEKPVQEPAKIPRKEGESIVEEDLDYNM